MILAAEPGINKSGGLRVVRPLFATFQSEMQKEFLRSGSQAEQRVLKRAIKKMEDQLAESLGELLIAGVRPDDAKARLKEEYRRLEALIGSAQKHNVMPRFLFDKPSLTALPLELARQGEFGAILEAEGGFWKSRLNPHLDDVLLKFYTGESFGSDTVENSVYLEWPILTICSLVQPKVLEDLYRNEALVAHGVIPRIIPFFAPSQGMAPPGLPCEPSHVSFAWYEQHMRALLSIERPEGQSRTPHDLYLTPEALAEIDRYQCEVELRTKNGEFERYIEFARKLHGHAIRLAAALHFLKHPDPHNHRIDIETMRGGIAFAEYFRMHAWIAYTPAAREGIVFAEKIYRWILRQRPRAFTERDAQNRIGHCTIEQIRAGVDELAQHGYIYCYTNGRTNWCVVHPGMAVC